MGLLRDAPDYEGSNERLELTALDGCAQVALAGGDLQAPQVQTEQRPADSGEARFSCRPGRRWAAGWEHFDVHAGVRVGAGDDQGRERLARYVLRPPLSLERLSLLPDGRVAYRVRHPLGPQATHRVMEPVELVDRLAALLPPPRFSLLRFHGVLAPASRWRHAVVPRPPEHLPQPAADRAGPLPETCHRPAPATKSAGPASPASPPPEVLLRSTGPAADAILLARATAAGCASVWDPILGEPVIVSPDGLTAEHWARLLDGLLLARSPYIDWPTLWRRSHHVDVVGAQGANSLRVLDCPRCHGRLRLIHVVADPDEATEFLAVAGLADPPDPPDRPDRPDRPQPRPRARDPTG